MIPPKQTQFNAQVPFCGLRSGSFSSKAGLLVAPSLFSLKKWV